MFKQLNRKRQKGQSTLEYAILIVVVIGALLTIQVYIKRGIQGRLRSATDDIGTQWTPGGTNTHVAKKTYSHTRETFSSGASSTSMIKPEISNVIIDEEYTNAEREFWG